MGKSKQKQRLALLMSAALLIGQLGTTVCAEGALAAPLTDSDGLNETVQHRTVQADTELDEPTPLAAPDEQGDVLTVTFNSNGSGGTDSGNNEMKAAIDSALLLSGKDKTDITTIRLNGSATEITEINWSYLLIQYNEESRTGINSDWDNLNALDLSGMANLKAVRTELLGVADFDSNFWYDYFNLERGRNGGWNMSTLR